MEDNEFDWYKIINCSDNITQGDIFLNFPITEVSNYEEILFSDKPEEIEADIELTYSDFIVLTQPCDIAQGKPELKNIILCSIHDVEESGFGKGSLCEILKGTRPQFYMMNQYKDREMFNFNFHIVNFNNIQMIPIDVLKKYADKLPERLRLLPPYREHLSQAFAKYFMRIGLPSDIDKHSFDKYKIAQN